MKIKLLDDENPKFNMAPMIDMVFLLLVFFMCASKVSQSQRLEMEIPEATKAVVPKERPDRWTVNILVDGQLFSGDQPVAIDDLGRLVKARLDEQPQLKVYIRADAGTEHAEVRKVMNALAEVGIDDFIFGVYKPGE